MDELTRALTLTNQQYGEKENTVYKKPLMLKIVGLSCDTVFYQVKIKCCWIHFTKSVSKFVHMMYILYPTIMREADKQHFSDVYELAEWLYNYGELIKPCETYIFYNKDGE